MTDKNHKSTDIVAVAKAAKVSISTVSRTFNHPNLVKPATRKRIEATVKRLGYIRNRAAQTIHGIRSGTIGLIVPTIDHMIFAELVQSFSDQIDDAGFTLLLASHGYDLNREYELTRKMLEHRVDGLALIGLDHAEETFLLLEQQTTPTALLWNYAPDCRLPCIGTDNSLAGKLVAEHVLKKGHQDVALVIPPTNRNDRAAQRVAGIHAALTDAGIVIPKKRTIETPYSVADAKAASAVLFEKHPPQAVICGNDVLATGVLLAAQKAGLSVPRDLVVAGIGDFKGSKDLEPALTTVRIPARKIGKTAAVNLTQAITGENLKIESIHILPELFVRASCPT